MQMISSYRGRGGRIQQTLSAKKTLEASKAWSTPWAGRPATSAQGRATGEFESHLEFEALFCC